MNIEMALAFSLSIWIAALLSLARFHSIRKEYLPFVLLVWLAALTEIITLILLNKGLPNIISSNVYNLLEALLLLIFFNKLGVFESRKVVYYVLLATFAVTWVLDNFVFHPFGTAFNSYFIIVYSAPVVILGIHTINGLLIKEKKILRNAAFFICLALIIYFTYNIIIETFYLYGLQLSGKVTAKIYDIHSWINLLCNLIDALAILWMRKKQAYTLQY